MLPPKSFPVPQLEQQQQQRVLVQEQKQVHVLLHLPPPTSERVVPSDQLGGQHHHHGHHRHHRHHRHDGLLHRRHHRHPLNLQAHLMSEKTDARPPQRMQHVLLRGCGALGPWVDVPPCPVKEQQQQGHAEEFVARTCAKEIEEGDEHVAASQTRPLEMAQLPLRTMQQPLREELLLPLGPGPQQQHQQ